MNTAYNQDVIKTAEQAQTRGRQVVFPNEYTTQGCRVIKTQYQDADGNILLESITLLTPEEV